MSAVNFIIIIEEKDADDEHLDSLARRLRDDLLEIGAESAVRPSMGEPPEGAKSIDIPTLNQIAVAVAPGTLAGLIGYLQHWRLRSKTRTLKIKTPGGFEIEFPTDQEYSEDQLLALVDKLQARE